MATAWKICLHDNLKSESELRSIMEKGFEELIRIDRWMSDFKEDSLISEINKNAGIKPIKVTDEAYDVLKLCQKHSELTGGAFDITFNAFFGLYDWHRNIFPSKQKIQTLLPLVNYKKLILGPSSAFLSEKGMRIGLGGMGQGYAVDKVVEIMKSQNVPSGYVDGSGDTYFWGVRPGGKLWTVGIGDPRPQSHQSSDKVPLYQLYITDVAVTTAGDTEKYFVRNGKRYHHIIDPKTGMSADKSSQVTVICPTATLCDVSDDGIFILGPDKGFEYADKIGVHVVHVDQNGNISLSRGLKPVQTKWGPSLEIRK